VPRDEEPTARARALYLMTRSKPMFIFVYVFSRGSFLASSYEHGRTSVFRDAHVTSTQREPSSEGEKEEEKEEERIPGADKGDRQRRDSLAANLDSSEREREREREIHARIRTCAIDA